jgi:hypothetical protein
LTGKLCDNFKHGSPKIAQKMDVEPSYGI